MKKLVDSFGRVHKYLRFSVTDKCNLNCVYCNPAFEKIKLLKNSELLTARESFRLINIFVNNFGFEKLRFTGGEPLARKEILELLDLLRDVNYDWKLMIGITTNGTLLKDKIQLLKDCGVSRLNISLDSLKRNRFFKITGKDLFNEVVSSIDSAVEGGFSSIKVNCVVMKGINEDEILDFAGFAVQKKIEVRFIEYMPFSSNGWAKERFIPFAILLEEIKKHFEIEPVSRQTSEVANSYELKNTGGRISFISSISDHFCGDCNRLRITSTGNLKYCLFSPGVTELNLKKMLRDTNLTDEIITEQIEAGLKTKEFKHPDIEQLIKLTENNMLSIGG